MKQIFFTLALLCATNLLPAQITSSGGQVYIHTGDLASFTNPSICVLPAYNYISDAWYVRIHVGCGVDSVSPAEFQLTFTTAEIDAFTGTGTETGAVIDAIEQAVIAYLEGITENSGITFSN